jgi:hypothetical protein
MIYYTAKGFFLMKKKADEEAARLRAEKAAAAQAASAEVGTDADSERAETTAPFEDCERCSTKNGVCTWEKVKGKPRVSICASWRFFR